MKIFTDKISTNKARLLFLAIVFIGVFGIANSSFAYIGRRSVEGAVLAVLGWIANIFVLICGWMISTAIHAVGVITQYNKFINEPSIIEGWVIVRNLCNMFFVLVLLAIAFATILRYENYSMKRLLPKLIIMAILINFSRMICGLIIDFSQVVMLTFVNAIKNPDGSFTAALGVDKYLAVVEKNNWTGKLDFTGSLAGIIVAIIFLIVATVVMFTVLMVFIMRIVMLWLYVVLSPLAFLLSAFPRGQQYASQWWGDFIKYVVTGPVLAFFVWLALSSANTVATIDEKTSYAPNEILRTDYFLNFLIAIGMLIGGLMLTQQLGGITGNMAGKGIGWAKSAATKYTGARYVGDRWGAFQAQRAGARKEKIALKASRDFGLYTGVKSLPRALSNVTGLSKVPSKLNPLKGWQDRRNEKKANWATHEENLQKAAGKEGTFRGEGDLSEYSYTNKNGRVTVRKTGKRDDVMSASTSKVKRNGAFAAGMAPATALLNKYKQKISEAAGADMSQMSLAQQRQFVGSGMANTAQAQAFASNVAKAGAFQNQEDLKKLQRTLAGNTAALDAFNSEAEKKGFGQWAYDKDKFASKVDSGDIKLKDTNIKVIADSTAFKEFAEHSGDEIGNILENMSKRSPKAQKAVKDALTNEVKSYGDYHDAPEGSTQEEKDNKKKEIRVREAYASSVGDYEGAFKGNKTAQANFISRAPADALKSMIKYNKNDEQKLKMISQNLKKSQIDSLSKAMPGELFENIKSRWEQHNNSQNPPNRDQHNNPQNPPKKRAGFI